MRPRALAFLLVLTVADYMLWNWSIAGGHDIVSLVAGLTLLPLGTVSIAQLVLGAARIMGLLLGRPSHSTRARRTARAAMQPNTHDRLQRWSPIRRRADSPPKGGPACRLIDERQATLPPASRLEERPTGDGGSGAARAGRNSPGGLPLRETPHRQYLPPAGTIRAATDANLAEGKRPGPFRLAFVRLHQEPHPLLPGLADD